jgi:hypothetical protein
MKNIIEGIRGVAGVMGVILWEKNEGNFERVLPARIDDAASEHLCELLSAFCHDNKRVKEAIIRLTEGWLILYDSPQFALLIMARNDLNRATLKVVLRSALTSIKHTLGSQQTARRFSSRFSAKHVSLLIRTINLSLSFFQGNLPKFEIAGMLRQVKEDLLDDHPVLKNLTVDANGAIIPIRGAEKSINSSFVAASAQLIIAFLEVADTHASTAGFDIEKLTEGISKDLEALGFYAYFQHQKVSQ